MDNKESSRYPYTYCADFIRMNSGVCENGLSPKLSRADAVNLKRVLADALGIDERKFAEMVADKCLESPTILTSKE